MMGAIRAVQTKYTKAQIARYIAGARNNTKEIEINDRLMWELVVSALKLYAHPKNWNATAPIEPFPAEMASAVAHQLRFFTEAGKTPPAWQNMVARDGRRNPEQDDGRRAAVTYIAAVRANRVACDGNVVHLVACWFGVTVRSVQEWMADPELGPPEELRGEAAEPQNANKPWFEDPQLARVFVQQAGYRHQALQPKKRDRMKPPVQPA